MGKLSDGKGYGQSRKKEGKAEDKIINKDKKDLVFVPGEFDEVERERIEEQKTGKNEERVKEATQTEEIL